MQQKNIEQSNQPTINSFQSTSDVLIDVKNVSMKFRLPSQKVDNLKETFIKMVTGKLHYKDFWALKDVTLQVKRGQSLALIGRNGAGKSTLLSLISGIFKPTSGSVCTCGTIVPLLRLGAGFDPNATGKENVFLNGAILGFSKKTLEQKYQEIVDFAELQQFVDVPVKNYSSGMVARLGFAIAVAMQPDIMICDEILSVGDIPFQKKCADKIAQLQQNGTTFLLVTHSMDRAKRLCQSAIWLDNGQIVQSGGVDEVTTAYKKECTQ